MVLAIAVATQARKRFDQSPRAPYWRDVDADIWSSWIWQQQNRVRTLDQARKILGLTQEEAAAFDSCAERFPVAITPYYASLIDRADPCCPIRLQAIPRAAELTTSAHESNDSLAEDQFEVTSGLTHRYRDRALIYVTHHCAMYCRHCTRRRKVSDPSAQSALVDFDRTLKYIRSHPEIRDVIVSGGDPLSLSDNKIDEILSALRAIDHIEIIRIGTRNPVTLPQRITPALAQMLAKARPIFIQTHFNHPRECTQEAFDACSLLSDAGCVLSNQMVLLRGVNDNEATVLKLNQLLLLMRVRPYTIFQCDLSEGLSHFRAPLETGTRIIDNLRRTTSGLAIPHFVVDLPHGGGKVFVTPSFIERKEGNRWQFRADQNKLIEYVDPT